MARLGALDRIGDPVLISMARLAQSITGASSAAVHIFDDRYQRRIAAACAPMVDHPADDSFCRLVVEDGTRLITPDAVLDPRLAYSSLVGGPEPLRFFAGLPLTVQGDTTVGTLCAFDTQALELDEKQIRDLEDLAGLVRAHLELMHLASDLGREATRDGLTGATTRVLFDGLLGRAMADRRRDGGEVLVALLDLDDFKSINDTYGHGVGDDALRWVGRRLHELLGPEVTVGRLGGDEFAVMLALAGEDPDADAEDCLARMRSCPRGFEPAFRVSVGSAYAEDDDDVSSLLRRADQRMYVAKAAQRGQPLS